MACGTPVVASSAGALAELVEATGGGLLVPPGDPDALAKALLGLLEQPATRAALGARARPRVEELFSWPRVAARTVDAYREVLAERRTG
jgi:glycosyltransferase involved in cell wall biosynthesis